MEVSTPLGEYPFEFRGLERRGTRLLVRGTVAGLESSAVLGPDDLAAALKALTPALALAGLAALALRRARR